MLIICRDYIITTFKNEVNLIVCPVCLKGNEYDSLIEGGYSLKIMNCGFVNCEWAMRGVLIKNKESKIYTEGRTYDDKLYTFRECDYRTVWSSLDIMVKKQD